ncbi:MAG: hypothetical protein Kow0029_08320 [Candidatus Rifleibacteriota bacterium]
MKEIIPIGIIAEDTSASINFYRKVIGVQRVQVVCTPAAGELEGSVLRLESPDIELNSTEVRIRDRASASIERINQRIKFHCNDIEDLKARLLANRVQTLENNGKYSFVDLNGINWDIAERQAFTA